VNDKKPDLDEDTQNQVKINVLMMRAIEAYDEGEYQDAADLLKEAVDLVPENANLWFELARNYRELGDYPAEIDCYMKIIELRADDAELWLNMALSYRIIGKAPEEMFCLIMASDKGTGFIGENEEKAVVIDRYKELVAQKIRARNPFSKEDIVPIYTPELSENPDQATCIVCFQKIDKEKEKGQILMCPHCKRVGHFVCLASWLQDPSRQVCPVCQGSLDFTLENYDLKSVMGIDDHESEDQEPEHEGSENQETENQESNTNESEHDE
jgi:tetratricopeptide (TPR) repeat protein